MTDLLSTYQRIKGVSSLYGWQRECLEDTRLIDGRENFLFWLPTGAGKTLVAEVLMLRETILHRRNCMLILPYVALVQEKVASLACLEEELGVVVEEYAASKGRFPPIRRRRANSIYVCTIEKANGLANSLIEKGRADDLGMVIVDEIHMLGEAGGRGATLEQCLCKLMMFRPPQRQQLQLVGMSATLGNARELCQFLGDAQLFRTHFRPVALVERIKVDSTLYRVDDEEQWRVERELGETNERRDPDGISKLLGNLLKGSVLIFCPTKQSCENVCRMLSNLCPKELREHRSDERNALISQLRDEHDGHVCPILQMSIRHGVAFHHSGLAADERELVESAYKSGVISIVCCTSTLAAGVNLPARRVIIRAPYVGREPMGKAQYLQMIGRAGRAGLDEKGDSIVMLHHGPEAQTFKRMHEGPIDACRSGLQDEIQRQAFFMDLIVLKLCHSLEALHLALRRSLFGIQQMDDEAKLLAITEGTIQSLMEKQMIVRKQLTDGRPTKKGPD